MGVNISNPPVFKCMVDLNGHAVQGVCRRERDKTYTVRLERFAIPKDILEEIEKDMNLSSWGISTYEELFLNIPEDDSRLIIILDDKITQV